MHYLATDPPGARAATDARAFEAIPKNDPRICEAVQASGYRGGGRPHSLVRNASGEPAARKSVITPPTRRKSMESEVAKILKEVREPAMLIKMAMRFEMIGYALRGQALKISARQTSPKHRPPLASLCVHCYRGGHPLKKN